jgi:hypothetical protein
VAEQIRASDMVMNANLGAAQAAEIFLCLMVQALSKLQAS